MTKISLITTFYNPGEYLIQSVNSILSQKISGNICVEYILVNDCSTDDSENMLNNFIEEFKQKNSLPNWLNITLYTTEKNLGCGGARKFGIDHATGDYLMFLDADDYYIHNDFIERATNKIIETGADIVEYGMVYNTMDGKQHVFATNKEITIHGAENALIALYRTNTIKFHVWSKIISKEIVDSFPYSTERTYEDVLTIPIWLSSVTKVVVMPTIEINYRATQNSIIREKISDTRLGTCRAILYHFDTFSNYRNILIAMYVRAYLDLSAVLDKKTSDDPYFNEMSEINTKMLSYIFPDTYKDFTFNIENEYN